MPIDFRGSASQSLASPDVDGRAPQKGNLPGITELKRRKGATHDLTRHQYYFVLGHLAILETRSRKQRPPKMSQNIYDTPEFFANYSQIRRSREGLAGAVEWPRLQMLLPDLTGARVVDLGCGMGWYCRWMREHGAASVRGIDLSENMLTRAREMDEIGGHDGISYERADLDKIEVQQQLFPESDTSTVDFVFSSLAVHYFVNLPQLVPHVHRILKPGGTFVFSAEHPIFTAPSGPGIVEIPVPRRQGAETGEETLRRVWPLNDYQIEGLRVTNWLADGVRKYHRTTASYINILLDAGFELTGFNEWHPTKEEIEANPLLAADHPNDTIKPTFLLMRGTKKVPQ